MALNGANVTEGSWNAAIAGEFGAPVVMISGDDAAIAEVRRAVGNIEAAETKRSLGFHSANTLTPQAAAALIRQRVEAAIRDRQRFKPYRVTGPVTVDVSFKNYMPAEVLAYLPIFERTDSHSVRFGAKDMAVRPGPPKAWRTCSITSLDPLAAHTWVASTPWPR